VSNRKRRPGRAGGPSRGVGPRAKLTDDEQFAEFVREIRKSLVPKITSSAYVMSLLPVGDVDVKFAVELGLSIMLDKPIILMVRPGSYVPAKLRQIAVAEIEMDDDPDTEEGQARLAERVNQVFAHLEAEGFGGT
jgi:hypothetical protein